ncbi:MAG: PIN domain-containing protein [Deltaproteobacteria bacterium]|jgi:predicted nucleic acid-binding protein|nr:PIN domain-containing protein [Deltaproteobacteria bacterium]
MIEPVFVDSFAWIAAINKSDNYHEISLRILEELLNKQAKLITTNYVVVETINALRNGDGITSPSRRIDLGQICSISNHKS